MIKNSLLLFFIISFNSFLFCQKNIYQHFTTEDGLAHDITYQIIQDKHGFIWIGTDDGLSKFNGNIFSNYNYRNGLTSNYVINIIEKGDSLIIGTWGGGLHILYNNKISKNNLFNDKDSKINKLGLLKNKKIYAKNNNQSFLIYNQNKSSNNISSFKIKESNDSYSISSLKKNSISINETIIDKEVWIHASEETNPKHKNILGVFKMEDNQIVSTIPFLKDKKITAITKIRDTIYAINDNILFTLKNDKLISKYNIPLPFEKILKIKKNNNKLYFLALNSKNQKRKLFELSLRTKSLINISDQLKIKSYVSDFIFDKDNNLWITTYGQGVYLLQNNKNHFLDEAILTNAYIQDLLFLNDTLFLLSRNSIQALKNNSLLASIETTGYTEHFNKNNKRKGIQFISYFNNNLKYKRIGKTPVSSVQYKPFKETFKNNTVERKKGLLLFKSKDSIIREISFESEIINIKSIENNIYVNLFKGGLYQYDFNGNLLKKYNKKNYISTNIINDFLIQKNQLYIATDKGLYIFKKNITEHKTISDGLLSNHINTLFIDKHHILWIGTQRGLNALKNNRLYTFDKSSGQKSSFITKINEHNCYLYIAGNKGVFIINNKHPYTPKKNSYIKIYQKNYTFNIQYINYINFDSLKIEYKINNNQWNSFSGNELSFKNLKQGEHKIIFRYKDSNDDWTSTSIYKFEIHLAWYKQPWLYFLYISLGLCILTYFIYQQFSKIKKKNAFYLKMIEERDQFQIDIVKIRNNIAQDFHDDLGNKLATISILAQFELNKLKNKNLYNSNITQIKQDADFLYNNMRDFIWTLDSKNNTLIEVLTYLNDFGEHLFENQNITFLSTNNLPKHQINLPTYWNKQLILVFKEAMTNILKHSKATTVSLNFEVTSNSLLKIILKDNGIGFNNSNLSHINGLQNMKNRITRINSNLEITSNGSGVTVFFEGLIKNNIN